MLKFITKLGMGRHLVGLGLSRKNIGLLQTDCPIVIDLQEVFGLPPIQILIFSGDTEESMKEQLGDLIGPDTIVIDHKKGVKAYGERR